MILNSMRMCKGHKDVQYDYTQRQILYNKKKTAQQYRATSKDGTSAREELHVDKVPHQKPNWINIMELLRGMELR